MKINGKVIEQAPPEIIVIPRQSGDVVFEAHPILDYSNFDAHAPMPKPPEVRRPGDDAPAANPDDPKYRESMNDWAAKKTDWMVITSLKSPGGLVWDTVKVDDPESWKNYKTELAASGFSEYEINRIMDTVFRACGLSTGLIEQATKNFLASQAEAAREAAKKAQG